MDTTRLKRFATEARNILMQGVVHRFTALGFLPDGTVSEKPIPMGGGAIFMGDTVSEDFYQKWCSLKRAVENHSIEEVAEEAAYTWFNRLVAIRIMVKNGLIAPVLQYESEGVHIPLLVSEARQGRMPELSADDQRKLEDLLLDDSQTAEQFSILIVAFCHSNPVINGCFGNISDYTELLLPTNILAEGGFVDMLNNTEFISEEDYHSPELIGWLYQFYISEKKDDVFAGFKKGKKAEAKDIPAATQIFTPNWIVKYMVQNTIGRIYLDNNPYEENIQKGWKYLVELSEPTPGEDILHYDDLKELKFADLACGSGHILNEGFDILYDLYILEGYSRKDAIENIFNNNLTGVDIDTRAKQLAQFALLLKACQKDSSFSDAHLMPKVLDMPDPCTFKDSLCETLPHFFLGGNQEMIQEVCDAIDLMDNAKNLGSIMKFNISERTRNAIMIRMEEYQKETHVPESILQLMPYMNIILALTDMYSALVMNPPYMGQGNMNSVLFDYVKNNYNEGKGDLMTVFMMKSIISTLSNGMWAMINIPSWMFQSTFEELRTLIINTQQIIGLNHNGRGVFGSDFGSVSFVMRNTKMYCAGIYRRLFKQHVQVRSVEKIHELYLDTSSGYYVAKQSNFIRIPGKAFGYWLNEKQLKLFKENILSNTNKPRAGLTTTDNDRFLRFWQEVSYSSIFFKGTKREDLKNFSQKWIPMTKGGAFRKWYGNHEYVLNFANDGEELKYWITHNPKDPKTKSYSRYIRNYDKYCEAGISFSDVTSGLAHFRWENEGLIPNSRGPYIYTLNKNILGYLNGIVARSFLEILCPSLTFNVGDIGRLPWIEINDFKICKLVESNVSISKLDWDSHEFSWDFETNPLVALCNHQIPEGFGASSCRIENLFEEFEGQWTNKFMQLHRNEEELNRQFIAIYGLEDELTPDVLLDEITILQQGEITIEDNQLKWNADVVMKQLISYAVGCMMGRYSIHKPGLILANQGDGLEQYNALVPQSRFDVDDDGIIPLMPADCDFTDNASVRFKQWLSVTFGPDTLVENLNFIEKSLCKSIDDYFVKDFWKDHKKMYQNRPIYWLFSSKKGAFQCIAYMHRMNAYTAERIRTKYLLPYIEWLMQKRSEMEANAANLTTQERRQLDNIVKQIEECREYHDRLHVIADLQIAFDLDDGVVVNYAKFGDVLQKIK